MKSLILTGFMGTGKTTVGRLLARRYGLEFVDTDEEVERLAGENVADLFRRRGEADFRSLETEVLRKALIGTGKVVATGGGALVSDRNRSLLTEHHDVICLTCGLDSLAQRLGTVSGRPLFDADRPASVAGLLAERASAYARYPQIDTTDLAPGDVADAVNAVVSLEQAAAFSVSLPAESTILFAEGLIARLGQTMRTSGLDGSVFVLTDSRVAALPVCAAARDSLTTAGYTAHVHVIPEGEEQKTLETMSGVYGAAIAAGLDRSSVVVGLGGGVIGDMAGMLAATLLRGVELVLIPTTLLSAVDAAIGGKVGVDFHGAKNMIGAFKPARIVSIDPTALRTLPPALVADGMAEVIKIGFMRSRQLIELLDRVDPARVLDSPEMIRCAAGLKVEVVRRDPLESGERMFLNFGHTMGHGLEAASGFRVSHGRAISIGMVLETRIAVERGWCRPGTLDALESILRRFSLPTECADVDVDQAVRFVAHDKKRRDGRIRLAIPEDIGHGRIVEVTLDDVGKTLRATREA